MNKLKLMYKINDYRDGKIDWDELSDLLDEFVRFECEREPVAKNLHKLLVSGSLPEDATTCLTCGEFEPHCKCENGYKRQ